MQRKQLHHFVVVVTAASLERFGPESWQDRWKGQMLLHHVEANSLVPCRIDPQKLKWGSENCTWGIVHEGEGSCAGPSEQGVGAGS